MSILKKNSFEIKFPMFASLITNEEVRRNMMENTDLIDKCSRLSTSITIFLQELDQHFDIETQMDIIINSVFKYPTEILSEFITAYLNSPLYVKCNSDIVKYYNKILRYGEDCIKYVSKNGIITNSNRYNNLPNEVVDEMFNSYVDDSIKYKNETLIEYKERFNTDEKKVIIDLLENNCWNYITDIFVRYEISLFSLITSICKSNIGSRILNENVKNILGDQLFKALVIELFGEEVKVTENVWELLNMNMINELSYLIVEDKISVLSKIDKLMIPSMTLIDFERIVKKEDTSMLVKEDK